MRKMLAHFSKHAASRRIAIISELGDITHGELLTSVFSIDALDRRTRLTFHGRDPLKVAYSDRKQRDCRRSSVSCSTE